MPRDIWGLAASAYFVASRLTYVLFVGTALQRQDRDERYTRTLGAVEAFRRFRRTASLIMNNDGFAFILLCVVTRNTLFLPVSINVSLIAGAVLVVIGVGIKVWAARTLGSAAYYWHNFFDPESTPSPVSTGPYRFFSNPMYTVGYLHTYGLALMLRSLPGLIGAAFAQAAILSFYLIVEKPHFERLHRESPPS
jgi:protein-S-isoprenylcysteine O-methyltransferase Ste14